MRTIVLDRDTFDEVVPGVLEQGGVVRVKVRGSCMFPTLRCGDTLVVKKVDFSAIAPPDIIVYDSPDNRHRAHRVIKRYGGEGQRGVITRGDNMVCAGEKVVAERIVGRVCLIERKGRRFHPDRGLYRLLARLLLRTYPCGAWALVGLRSAYLTLYRMRDACRCLGKKR